MATLTQRAQELLPLFAEVPKPSSPEDKAVPASTIQWNRWRQKDGQRKNASRTLANFERQFQGIKPGDFAVTCQSCYQHLTGVAWPDNREDALNLVKTAYAALWDGDKLKPEVLAACAGVCEARRERANPVNLVRLCAAFGLAAYFQTAHGDVPEKVKSVVPVKKPAPQPVSRVPTKPTPVKEPANDKPDAGAENEQPAVPSAG